MADRADNGAVPEAELLPAQAFGRGDVTRIRHAVTAGAASVGLAGTRLEDFALAVNEIVTNAVRHAGGSGRVRMFASDGHVCCEVIDSGGGIPDHRVDPERPATFASGGRGIWLARRLCDEMTVRTGPTGTTVCISVAVGPPAPPAQDQSHSVIGELGRT
jgi:anti-sigma regulatory factor (Ser/Thr protein kinase)